jgi:hypothetical protein
MADPASQGRLAGQVNIVKLQGSFNWRSADGRNLLVVGTDKTATMPLLPCSEIQRLRARTKFAARGSRTPATGS